MNRLDCPACGEEGEHVEEDQAACKTPACRVTTFQTTTPPDQARETSRSRAVRGPSLDVRYQEER